MKKSLIFYILLMIVSLSSIAQNITLSLENASITNDGLNDYYEVDVFLSSDTDYVQGSGQFLFTYNTAAFGVQISNNNAITYERPLSSVLGSKTINVDNYTAFVTNDNTDFRTSFLWQQFWSSGTIETNITNIPVLLVHVKILYVDTNESPEVCFETTSHPAFDDQFFTACGPFTPGFAAADCINEPGSQLFNYAPDCSGATLSTCTSTTWNGTVWDNGTPDATMAVIINGNYDTSIVNENIDACELTVNPRVTLTIASGDYLKVENNITVEGTLNVFPQGSVVQVVDTATVNGNGTFITQVATTSMTDTRYTYFSSPSQNETIDVFSPWAVMDNIFSFDGVNQEWQSNTASDAMIVGRGYIARPPTSASFPLIATTNFNGAFNNGIITHNLTYNVDGDDNDNELIGNPYPSAINTAALLANNPRANAFYFWTHASASSDGTWGDDYVVWNASGSATSNTIPAPTYIASGQGFFVGANGNTGDLSFTFNNSLRVADNNDDFLRITPSTELAKIWLNLTTTDNTKNSQLLVAFNPICSEGFDAQYDAVGFNNSNPISFYSSGLGERTAKLAIQTTGLLSNDTIISLGFNVEDDMNTNLKISIDHLENFENTIVYLKDNMLDITHNLSETAYHFNIQEIGEFNTRFELLFNQSELNINDLNLMEESLIVSNQEEQHILIKTINGSKITKIEIYDILGKLLIERKTTNTNNILLETDVHQGIILFIKATLDDGVVLNKKFIKL